MKKVLVIIAGKEINSSTWSGFFNSVKTQLLDDIAASYTFLDDIVFDISNAKSVILDAKTGDDIASNDLVIIRNVGKWSDAGITLAQYLKSKGVSFTDAYLGDSMGSGKLACSMLRVVNNLPIPRTVYANNSDRLLEYIKRSDLAFPMIFKDNNGKKGRDNYLVKSLAEIQDIKQDHPNIHFIAQEFIPNDGDYRILVMGGKISLVIKRTADGKSHLNNTSQGGSAKIELQDLFSKGIKAEIIKAAEVEKLEVAGVDLIIDRVSGRHYFLEVNRAPQLSTGSFVDEKSTAYADLINRSLK